MSAVSEKIKQNVIVQLPDLKMVIDQSEFDKYPELIEMSLQEVLGEKKAVYLASLLRELGFNESLVPKDLQFFVQKIILEILTSNKDDEAILSDLSILIDILYEETDTRTQNVSQLRNSLKLLSKS